MTKKEKEFKFVPQVEIDGKFYHESATVSLGIVLDKIVTEVAGQEKITRIYKLVKYVIDGRGKVAEETVLRSEEGVQGREVVKYQLDIELRKELKRLDKDL